MSGPRSAFDHAAHLVRRFVGSLSPRPPDVADEVWAESHLLPGEQRLWRRMNNQDRRHAITVARRFERFAGASATRPALAGALLHDVGKVDSDLGTFQRVVATLVPDRWARGRIRRYRQHEAIGAGQCQQVGSDELTVALVLGSGAPDELQAALAAADEI